MKRYEFYEFEKFQDITDILNNGIIYQLSKNKLDYQSFLDGVDDVTSGIKPTSLNLRIMCNQVKREFRKKEYRKLIELLGCIEIDWFTYIPKICEFFYEGMLEEFANNEASFDLFCSTVEGLQVP